MGRGRGGPVAADEVVIDGRGDGCSPSCRGHGPAFRVWFGFPGARRGRAAGRAAVRDHGSISLSATWPVAAESRGLRRRVGAVALDGRAVGVLDGAQPGGDPGFAGGDGLAVASAVGAFGQALAELLDLADVGLALVGVRGDGEDGGVGGGGVQDEADRLAVGVAVGQGDDLGSVGLRPGLLRAGRGPAWPAGGGRPASGRPGRSGRRRRRSSRRPGRGRRRGWRSSA